MALARAVVMRAVQMNTRPQEDWVNCLRGDNDAGKIWIGYRTKGLEMREFFGQVVHYDTGGATVRAIWTGPKAPLLVALYDGKNGGLKTLADVSIDPVDPPKDAPALPSPAKPPTAGDMLPLVKHLDTFQNDLKPGEAVFFGDDWNTGGDWVNHYGNSYAWLFFNENAAGKAVDAPDPYEREPGFKASVDIGPHKKDAGAHASYQTLEHKTDDPRILYSPRLGRRGEGGVNDGSADKEKYPASWEGPDLWLDIEVPQGEHYVSLYFRITTPRTRRATRLRDYEIQFLHPEESRELTLKGAPLAHARVSDFRGGVYKMFLVAGPAKYAVRIARNRSSITALQGLFIDHFDLFPEQGPLPGFDTVPYGPIREEIPVLEQDPDIKAADALWVKLGDLRKPGVAEIAWPFHVWTYRAAVGAKARVTLLTNWRWSMGVWDEDRDAFDKAMAAAFKAYSEKAKSGDNNVQQK